jgi:hypothetical protein
MAGKYKLGVKVEEKTPCTTNVQIAIKFASQINRSLEEHAQSLQKLDQQGEIPEKLYAPIQDFFAIVIQSSDQYNPSLKQITKNHLKQLFLLKSTAESFEVAINQKLKKSSTGNRKTLHILHQLIFDVHLFIQKLDLTHNSYKPGTRPNVRPVNWLLRADIHDLILEHQSKFGEGQYPHLRAAQIRAKEKEHQLPDRTYREIKTMHKNGTLFHYIQPNKRQ